MDFFFFKHILCNNVAFLWLTLYIFKIMKKIIVIFFCLFSIFSFAQQSFVVTNIQDEPLANVDVYIYPLAVITQTDDNGILDIDIELPQKSILVFSKEGYETFSFNFEKVMITQGLLFKNYTLKLMKLVSAINHQLSTNQVVALSSLPINSFSDNSLNFVERLSHIPGVYEKSTGTGIKTKLLLEGSQE